MSLSDENALGRIEARFRTLDRARGSSMPLRLGWWCICFTLSLLLTGHVLAQESFGDCVRFGGGCSRGCGERGNPSGCQAQCAIGFLGCVSGVPRGGDGGGGGRRVIERSGCLRDRTSSTGWRLRECFTLPGAPGQATRCSSTDECPAPACGPCACTSQPGGRVTCIKQCFRYSASLGDEQGNEVPYTRSCTVVGRPPSPQ
jgi:hypothetical protein